MSPRLSLKLCFLNILLFGAQSLIALPTHTLFPFSNTSVTATTGAPATTVIDDGDSAPVSTDGTGSAATSSNLDGLEIVYGPSSSIWLDLNNPTEILSVDSVLESESIAAFDSYTSYDREPQCTASWMSYLANNPNESTIFETRPFTVPPSSVLTLGNLLITGPTTYTATETGKTEFYGMYDACCGRCSITFTSVDVYYWPVPTPNTACLAHIDTRFDYLTEVNFGSPVPDTTRPASNTGNVLTLRAEVPEPAMQSYAISPGGLTLYSPNQYVLFRTVEASDLCGAVGGKYTSVLISFAPGELSTVNWIPFVGFMTVPFNPSDLPCAPLAIQSSDWADPAPGLAPYQPVIAPVSQLYELDSRFAGCAFADFQGIDPPYALTPASALTPYTTEADPVVITQAPRPQSIITSTGVLSTSLPPSPTPMGDPGDPLTDPVSQHDPPAPAPSGISPTTSNAVKGSPSVVVPPETDPPSNSPSAAADPASDPEASSPVADDQPSNTQPPATSPNTAAVIAQGQTVWDNGPAVTIAGHTVMYSASSIYVDGRPTVAIPTNSPGSNPLASSLTAAGLTFTAYTAPQPTPAVASEIITVAGQVFTANPSAIAIGGTTLAINGPAITLSGTPISLASAGLIIGGTQTIPIGPSAAVTANGVTITPEVITVAGQMFTANPSAFVIGGTTLAINGPAITLSGTPISLASAGLVIAGTQTIPIGPSATVITVAGQVFTANPSAFVIGGTTIAINGPAITLSGTPISLGSAGLVIGGTQTIPIGPSAAVTANGLTITPLPTGFIVDGSSVALSPGNSPITIDGIPVSLSTDANGGIVVIGTRTITFSPSATSAAGLGGLIISAFGGSVGSASRGVSTTHAAVTTYANGTIVYFQGVGDRFTALPLFVIVATVVACAAVSMGLL